MDRVVIAGGDVVDGTGAPAIAADVALEGDRIVEIGPNLRGDRRIDAAGCAVAPGFVDIHTHYDAQVFWDPAMTPSCFHGVTTVVAGNCGFSIAPIRPADRDVLSRTMEKVEDMVPACLAAGVPWDEFESFPEYLEAVRRRGTAVNFAAYIGHTPLRLYVLGADAAERAATPDEISSMVVIVDEAMAAGAAGFATSMAVTHVGADGRPIPSRVAERTELEALGRAVGRSGRGVIGVNGGDGLTFTDCYELQPDTGSADHVHCRVDVSQRRAPQGRRDPPARRGAGGGCMAAGDMPAAVVLRDARRAVQPEHQPRLRGADAALIGQAAGGVRRPGLAPASP